MQTRRVREYYDSNTNLFLAFGREQQTRTMHRAVWAPGVTTMDAALGYVNGLVAQQARQLVQQQDDALRVLDLGCGIGGTLFDLYQNLLCDGRQVEATGISISARQLQIAQSTARNRRLPIRFVEANFLKLPFDMHFDLAIGIESFVHASDPAALYSAAAGVLRPGGRLIVCDDFLCAHSSDVLLEAAFRRGWLAAGLGSVEQAMAYAQAAGLNLLEQRDLTPDLRLLDWPAMLVRPLLKAGLGLPLRWALMQNFVGGLALQHGLGQGVFRYEWLVFEKW